jgi:hypothetical protein
MSASWQFYRFDYDRYLELRPPLRAAQDPDEFRVLSENDVTDAVLSALEFGEIGPEYARNVFVESLCCLGEPLLLDPGLLRIVVRIAHRRGTEDLGEQLEALLGGRVNLEAWLIPGTEPPIGLLGFLTPQQTEILHATYGDVFRTGGKGRKRRRRGGLVGKAGEFLRQLLVLELKPEESLGLLGELIADAAERKQGVAVTTS